MDENYIVVVVAVRVVYNSHCQVGSHRLILGNRLKIRIDELNDLSLAEKNIVFQLTLLLFTPSRTALSIRHMWLVF